MTRVKAREKAFFLIFERISLGEKNQFSLDNFLTQVGEQGVYLQKVSDTLEKNLAFLTRHIEKAAISFKLERIFKIDFSLLLLANIEILFFDDVPDLVALNEVVELSKIYSGEKSQKFIHGILGAMLKQKDRLLYLYKNPKEDVDDVIENKELRMENDCENGDSKVVGAGTSHPQGEGAVDEAGNDDVSKTQKPKNPNKNEVREWRAKL